MKWILFVLFTLPTLAQFNPGTAPFVASLLKPSGAAATDLVMGLEFEEGSGTTTEDISTFNNDGTLQNGASFDNATACKIGSYAVLLDGGNDSVRVTDAASIRPSTAMTISFKMYAANVTGNKMLVDHQSGSPYYGYVVGLYGNVIGANVAYNANSVDAVSVTTISASTCYYITVTYDGANIRIYIDGTLDSTTAATGTITYTVTQDLGIGIRCTDFSSNPFGGQLDDVRIYSRALSGAEITTGTGGGGWPP